MEIIEKVAYLKGLAEGLALDTDTKEGKLIAGEQTNIFDPNFKTGCLMDINFYNVYLNILIYIYLLEF